MDRSRSFALAWFPRNQHVVAAAKLAVQKATVQAAVRAVRQATPRAKNRVVAAKQPLAATG
jgi:hypothetical protein